MSDSLPIVLFLGPPEGAEAAASALEGRAVLRPVAPDRSAMAGAIVEAAALIDASMRLPLDRDLLRRAGALKAISTATTGADHIDRQGLSDGGIALHTLREDGEFLRTITPAAELSWALLLACARRLPAAVDHVRAGGWNREDFPGAMLHGRVLGLVGCGRIGQWMARYGAAFGMRVIGCDPHIAPWPGGIERCDLDALFAEADAVSVHVHLNDETRRLIGARQLAALRPGAIVINTSRGGIVDEAALLAALESGQLGAAALDVLEGEPDTADHPLVRYAAAHDNLLITPHCGGYSPDAMRMVCRRAAEKLLAYLAG